MPGVAKEKLWDARISPWRGHPRPCVTLGIKGRRFLRVVDADCSPTGSRGNSASLCGVAVASGYGCSSFLFCKVRNVNTEDQGQKVKCQGSFVSCFSTEISGFNTEKPENLG